MLTNNLGYPQIGSNSALKKAIEQYWPGKIALHNLVQADADIRKQNWILQKETGIYLIPSDDFSFYDQDCSLKNRH